MDRPRIYKTNGYWRCEDESDRVVLLGGGGCTEISGGWGNDPFTAYRAWQGMKRGDQHSVYTTMSFVEQRP